MKIEEKMDLLFEAAGTLFERGLQGVRVNYIYGKYFYHPVKDDLLIVNPKNEPEYTAELIYPLGERKKQKKPMLRIHKLLKKEQLPLFGEAIKAKFSYQRTYLGELEIGNADDAASAFLEEIHAFTAGEHIFSLNEARYFREIYKNHDPSPEAAAEGFAGLVEIAAYYLRTQEWRKRVCFHDAQIVPLPPLVSSFLGCFLLDFNLKAIMPEALAEILNLSRKEREYLTLYQFLQDLDAPAPNGRCRIYLPFLKHGLFPYMLGHRNIRADLTGFAASAEEARWAQSILALTGLKAMIEEKIPEEALLADVPHADWIYVFPPPLQYIYSGLFAAPKFELFAATKRSKERVEVLALERALRLLPPGGKLFMLVTRGLMTNKSDEKIRQNLILAQSEVKAIVGFPAGALHKQPGYQLNLLYLQKKEPGVQAKEKVFVALAPEFTAEHLKEISLRYHELARR